MENYFFDSIQLLRSAQKMVIYNSLIQISSYDENLVADFLNNEWGKEKLNYPGVAPIFDKSAAVWAAKIIYTASQVLLYRENKNEDLEKLLPSFKDNPNPSNILSIDLTLRFLPQILLETKNIDPDDELIPILEKLMSQWHYSGIGLNIENLNPNFDIIFGDDCLKQLYLDRIIEKKDKTRIQFPKILHEVNAIMGNYAADFWNNYNEK